MAINDPRDIPGLLLWYSAEAEAANYTDGQAMTGWTDLSGNGRHATPRSGYAPTFRASGGAGGGPCVRFNSATGGGRYFLLPTGMMIGRTAAEIRASLRASSASNGGKWRFGSGAEDYPYGGMIYSSFGASSHISAAWSVDPQTWHRFGAWASATNHGFQQNSLTPPHNNLTKSVGWNGDGIVRLGSQSDSWSFIGDMSCVVLFDHVLSPTERADLDAWMAANPSGGGAGPSNVTVPGESFAGSVAMLDGTAHVAAPVTVAGEAFSIATSMLDGSGAYPLKVLGQSFRVTTSALDGAVAGAQLRVLGESFRVTTTTLDGTALIDNPPPVAEASTDAVDRSNGRTRVCEWTVEIEPPVTEPTRTRGHDEAVAYSISEPAALVDGRPT